MGTVDPPFNMAGSCIQSLCPRFPFGTVSLLPQVSNPPRDHASSPSRAKRMQRTKQAKLATLLLSFLTLAHQSPQPTQAQDSTRWEGNLPLRPGGRQEPRPAPRPPPKNDASSSSAASPTRPPPRRGMHIWHDPPTRRTRPLGGPRTTTAILTDMI